MAVQCGSASATACGRWKPKASGSHLTSPGFSTVWYSARAERQVDALRIHYQDRGRLEAVRNLDRALDEAEERITREPEAGLAAPRPYPEIARMGEAWIMAGRYWIGYGLTYPPVILAVFDATADIPGRL